ESYEQVLRLLRDPTASLAEAESLLAQSGIAFGPVLTQEIIDELESKEGGDPLLLDLKKPLFQRRRDSANWSSNEAAHWLNDAALESVGVQAIYLNGHPYFQCMTCRRMWMPRRLAVDCRLDGGNAPTAATFRRRRKERSGEEAHRRKGGFRPL